MPVICRSWKSTSLCQTLGVIVTAGRLSVGAGGGVIGLVDRIFIFAFRMWPFAVAIDFGRCLRTRLDVRPGQVAKNPAPISLIDADGTGLKAA